MPLRVTQSRRNKRTCGNEIDGGAERRAEKEIQPQQTVSRRQTEMHQRGKGHDAVKQIQRHGQAGRPTAQTAKDVIDDAERRAKQPRQEKLRRLRGDRKLQRHPKIRPNRPRRGGVSSS